MTAREPDPVSGPVVARVAVSRRDGRRERVEHGAVGHVTHPVARVHGAPGEVDALVHEPELAWPAADLVEHAARHGYGALPDEGHVTGGGPVLGTQAGDPVARAGTAFARVDA